MKKELLMLIALLFAGSVCYSQSNKETMEEEIKTVVLSFEKATAQRNTGALENILHADYRVMANRFKGTTGVTLIPRATYLAMMKEGKIGGTTYDTEVIQISESAHTAMAEVLYKAKDASDMHKYLFLVQNDKNEWQVISDLPLVIE